MKPHFSVITLLLVMHFGFNSVFSQSEENNIRHNEINIVIEDIFARGPVYYWPGSYPFNHYIPVYPYHYDLEGMNYTRVGIGYKRHFKNSGIRSRLMFGSDHNETDFQGSEYRQETEYVTYKAYLGYEWFTRLKKIDIFYGMEGVISQDKYEQFEEQYADGEKQTHTSSRKRTEYGAGPLVGIKYFFTEGFSVSTEVKWNILFYEDKDEYKSSASPDPAVTKKTGSSMYIGPLGQIALNIHL